MKITLCNYTFLAIISCLISIGKSYCQTNLSNGYIINNNADTIHGLINYRTWEFTPEVIEFYKIKGAQAERLTINEIKGFGVDGLRFEKKTIDWVKIDSWKKYTSSPKIEIEKKEAFLQVLVEGNKKLLRLKRSENKEFFYVDIDGNISLLRYKRYVDTREGKEVVRENNYYKGQLVLYLSGDDDIQDKIRKCNYSLRSLSNLFRCYMEKKSPPYM